MIPPHIDCRSVFSDACSELLSVVSLAAKCGPSKAREEDCSGQECLVGCTGVAISVICAGQQGAT